MMVVEALVVSVHPSIRVKMGSVRNAYLNAMERRAVIMAAAVYAGPVRQEPSAMTVHASIV